MRKVLLHIGRHKTGTTAIQHFIGDNRDALLTAGYFVPLSGKVNAGHHGFSEPFRPGRAEETLQGDVAALPVFRQLASELTGIPEDKTLIISSEAFQNCRPAHIRQAFADFDARVLVYLRNQLEYLATAYVQRIHATNYCGTIDEYFQNFYQASSNYFAFLRNWTEAFPGAVSVRRYAAGAAIEDFCEHALGISPDPGFSRRSGDSNPSLNAAVTLFKRRLNERELGGGSPEISRTDPRMYFALPKLNTRFPGGKYSLPPDISEELLGLCLPSDTRTAEKYFDDAVLFDYGHYQSMDEPTISETDYRDMYRCLMEEMDQVELPFKQRA